MPPTLVQQPTPTQVQPAAPVSTPEAVKPTETPVIKEESILKRAATKQEPGPTTPQVEEMPKVTLSIDEVKDPVARQILQKKLEEANKGISEAFGKVGAEKSKYIQEVETLRKQLESQTNKRYTTSDVQALLQRQDFVQAATELQNSIAPQGVQQDTWSSWTPEEKQAFSRQQQETDSLKQQLFAMQQSQVQSQADGELKTEYPDYDSGKVNEFYQRAYTNQLTPKQLREAVYWATNGKELVGRAYELGKQDKSTFIQEKLNGISPNGVNITPTTMNAVEKKDGQRSSTTFSSHAHKVLDMLRNMPTRK